MNMFKLSTEFERKTHSEKLFDFKVNEEDGTETANIYIYFIADMLSVCIIYVLFLHVIVTYSDICQGEVFIILSN